MAVIGKVTNKQLIDADALNERFDKRIKWLRLDMHDQYSLGLYHGAVTDKNLIGEMPTVDAVEVVHGRWLLQANNERTNYRWNVTAECSECCDERKEIWAGFFPNVPDFLARDVAIESAKSVKLSNYCPNCGAKMELDD